MSIALKRDKVAMLRLTCLFVIVPIRPGITLVSVLVCHKLTGIFTINLTFLG